MNFKIPALLLFLCLHLSLAAQLEQYTCTDSNQTEEFIMYRGKTGYEVNKWDYLEIYMKTGDSAGYRSCCPTRLEGFYMGYSNQTLWLDLRTQRSSTLDTAGTNQYSITTYGLFSATYKSNCRPILPAQISHIHYSSRWRSGWHNASDVLMALSVTSALVVAPLAAMKNQGENFSYPQYLRWAGWSMAAFSVSLAIKVGTQPRKYYITPG